MQREIQNRHSTPNNYTTLPWNFQSNIIILITTGMKFVIEYCKQFLKKSVALFQANQAMRGLLKNINFQHSPTLIVSLDKLESLQAAFESQHEVVRSMI